jgi:hypothetical protein
MKTIEINVKYYTECDVILLHTDKESNLFIGDLSSQLHYNYSIEKGKSINQHLYILSNEEIKEGDWAYDKVLNIIFQTDKYTDLKYVNQTDNVKKIIATTDSSLTKEMYCVSSGKYQEPLPQIPQQFIEYYISEYNRGNVINKVLVEVDLSINDIHCDNWVIKLNQNNEISILTEKCEYMKEVGCIKDICIRNTGPKRETLEEAANKFASQTKPENSFEEGLCVGKALGFIEGVKYQAERMYNREKVVELLTLAWATASAYGDNTDSDDCSSWIKENLK